MSESAQSASPRRILLVPHTGRASNIRDAERAAELLVAAGIELRVVAREPIEAPSILSTFPYMSHDFKAAEGCELVLVLGGDGTFLRAADLARKVGAPVLGINLGHVGFLAEGERSSLENSIQRVIDKSYRVEDRMTIDCTVIDEHGEVIGEDWALNEASIENLDRSGVLDAISAQLWLLVATASWSLLLLAQLRMRSPRAGLCCGQNLMPSWWCPITRMRCLPNLWWCHQIPQSRWNLLR